MKLKVQWGLRAHIMSNRLLLQTELYKEFSNIQVNGTPLEESVFSTPTVLIPNMYKNDESLIKEHIAGEYDLLLNYNQITASRKKRAQMNLILFILMIIPL